MNKFNIFMNSVPRGQFSTIKNRIIIECVITDEIFKNWMLNRTQVPERYFPIIESIADKKVFTDEETENE